MKLCVLLATASLTFAVWAGDQPDAGAAQTANGGPPPQAGAWLPPERLVKWDPGVRGGIPSVPVACELSAADLPADGKTDISAKLQSALDGIKTPGAVLLPAGTFLLSKQINLKSGVVLRGAGLDKTHLRLRGPLAPPPGRQMGWSTRAAIHVCGARDKEFQITSGSTLGSSQVTLAAAAGLQAGQVVLIHCTIDPELVYNMPNAQVGQIVRLTQVTGNTVILDAPLRLEYKPERNPRLCSLSPVSDAGIENLHFRNDNKTEPEVEDTAIMMILFSYTDNCWVRDCETEGGINCDIVAAGSRHLTVENCYVHNAQEHSGGGRGYGVEMAGWSSDCLIQNNLFHTMRHAMIIQNEANGCVYAYNYNLGAFQSDDTGPPLYHQLPPFGQACEISLHGGHAYANLFEGNVVKFISIGDRQPGGPRNMVFRNRLAEPDKAFVLEQYLQLGGNASHNLDAIKRFKQGYKENISLPNHTHATNVIGNTLTEGGSIIIDASCQDTLVEGNLVNEKMQWNKAKPVTLPASLFLTHKPAFWGEKPWPGIGADVDQQTMTTLPAQDWFVRIKQAGHPVPFANP